MNRIPLGQYFSVVVCSLSFSLLLLMPANGTAQTPQSDKPESDLPTSETQEIKTSEANEAGPTADASEKDDKAKGKERDKKGGWQPLAGNWKACQFGGDGPVEIKDGLIKMGFGDPLTGIQWKGDVLRENYEVELEARRTDGFDFFCGLTFPVGKDHVSFILGGWGGGVVGISSIDGRDASENDTTSFQNFDNDKWYKVRVRVEPNLITCWIDDKVACDHERKDFEFDIRYEMDVCTPLGIAAFQCKSEIRNIRVRKLSKTDSDKK
ncbi:MAG: hypothetical protein GY904_36945 [Planctomycetaceae bacterium]|nr:hypothetical protein [Planctomycetaceae bacterium]